MPHYTLSDDPHAAVKNKLGATTHDELEQREAPFVTARVFEIETGHGPTGQFDAEHLKAIHRHLFQDVYEWAGHTRDEKVMLADGTVASEPVMRKIDGQPFMPGPLIAKTLDHVADELRAANYLCGLSRSEFAERAADIMAEINGAHAFREGNGRTQRVFIGELARHAGHELDFTVVSRERMIQASIAANEQGDPATMRRLFYEISTPSRVEALRPALEFLGQQGFPWNDRYVATTEPGHAVDVTMAGTAGDHFMARTESGILIGQVTDLPTPHPKRGEPCHLEPSPWPEPDRQQTELQGGMSGAADPPTVEPEAEFVSHDAMPSVVGDETADSSLDLGAAARGVGTILGALGDAAGKAIEGVAASLDGLLSFGAGGTAKPGATTTDRQQSVPDPRYPGMTTAEISAMYRDAAKLQQQNAASMQRDNSDAAEQEQTRKR